MLISSNCTAPEKEIARPNIILIMSDDQGFETVGAYGGESYKTPVLDKLAGIINEYTRPGFYNE